MFCHHRPQTVRALYAACSSVQHQQPKSRLVHFSLKRWHLIATILKILLRIDWLNFRACRPKSQQKAVLPETTEESRRPPPNQLLHFYTAVIRPVLEYASPVWHYSITRTQSSMVLPTGINPKTSSTYHLQWHLWHVISQRLIANLNSCT